MSSTEELLALARGVLDAAKPGEAVEVYAAWGRETEVKVYEGEVESLTSAESSGVGVRVISEGRLGYAYAADPDRAELAELVERARTNAALAAPDDGNVLPEPRPIPPLEGILLPELLEAAHRREGAARARDRARVPRGRLARDAASRPRSTARGSAGRRSPPRPASKRRGSGATAGRSEWRSPEVNGETQTGFGLQHRAPARGSRRERCRTRSGRARRS